MDSAGKRSSQMEPAHGPPLQARVAAANGTVSQLANMLLAQTTILAHMEWTGGQTKQNLNGARQNERGQTVEKGSGHGRQNWPQANKEARRTRQLQADTAGRLSVRHRPQNKQPAVGRSRSKHNSCLMMKSACLLPCSAGRWGECSCSGPQEGGLRPTYRPYPTYRLCLSLSLPTPLICKTQFSPKLTSFFFYYYFYPLLPHYNSSPNPL